MLSHKNPLLPVILQSGLSLKYTIQNIVRMKTKQKLPTHITYKRERLKMSSIFSNKGPFRELWCNAQRTSCSCRTRWLRRLHGKIVSRCEVLKVENLCVQYKERKF